MGSVNSFVTGSYTSYYCQAIFLRLLCDYIVLSISKNLFRLQSPNIYISISLSFWRKKRNWKEKFYAYGDNFVTSLSNLRYVLTLKRCKNYEISWLNDDRDRYYLFMLYKIFSWPVYICSECVLISNFISIIIIIACHYLLMKLQEVLYYTHNISIKIFYSKTFNCFRGSLYFV